MSKKYIDYKVTIWRRIHLKDDTDMKLIVEKIANDNPQFNEPDISEEEGFDTDEVQYETSEFLSISENGGSSTIEIYDNTHKENNLIYENGKY